MREWLLVLFLSPFSLRSLVPVSEDVPSSEYARRTGEFRSDADARRAAGDTAESGGSTGFGVEPYGFTIGDTEVSFISWYAGGLASGRAALRFSGGTCLRWLALRTGGFAGAAPAAAVAAP